MGEVRKYRLFKTKNLNAFVFEKKILFFEFTSIFSWEVNILGQKPVKSAKKTYLHEPYNCGKNNQIFIF